MMNSLPRLIAQTSRRFFGKGALALLLLSTLSLTSGCAEINKLLNGMGKTAANLSPPTVFAHPVRLTKTPTLQQLGAYYCPIVTTDQVARLACAVVLGSPPPRDVLQFQFGTTIIVHNPNNVPVPALDILLALKLFQGQAAEGLGAVCLSMCGAADASCTGAPKPGACTSNLKTIKTLNDFVGAVPGLVAGLATAALTGELRKSTIVANGDINLNLNFSLGIDQALRVIQKVINQVVQSQLQRGKPELVIPVSGEGTVFVELPGSGRVGVGFGPLYTSWRVL